MTFTFLGVKASNRAGGREESVGGTFATGRREEQGAAGEGKGFLWACLMEQTGNVIAMMQKEGMGDSVVCIPFDLLCFSSWR